jgi:hypothetical protein
MSFAPQTAQNPSYDRTANDSFIIQPSINCGVVPVIARKWLAIDNYAGHIYTCQDPFVPAVGSRIIFYSDFIKVLDNGTSAPCGVQWGH